jgi:TctA family transporter
MGLTWALGWAIAGVLIGVASIVLPGLPWNAFFEVFDAPLPAFAIPGFFAGVFFSTVLGIAGRRRRFRELSLPRFAAWGAVGGLLLTLFPFALVAVGLASREGSNVGTWQAVAVITGPFILLSAVSASLTLRLARIVEGRELREARNDVADGEVTEGEGQALVGGGSSSLHGRPVGSHAERVRPDPASRPSDA